MTSSDLASVLHATGERRLRPREVELLLRAGPDDAEKIAARAGELARRHFGKQVFIYGFVYISTNCLNDCTFCHSRKDNDAAVRYRKSDADIADAVHRLVRDGVHCVDLTSGEDPQLAAGGWEVLRAPVEAALSAGAAVMVSPGVVDAGVLRRLRDWGADWYALYQESYEPELYPRLRPGQPASARVGARSTARRLGLLTEDGLLLGVGETIAGLARGVLAMGSSQQVRAMGFVPQPGVTHPGDTPPPWREKLACAVLRLCHPDCMIPATLDSAGAGMVERLRSGANVVTSVIPPGLGLRGVAQPTRGVEDGARSTPRVDAAMRAAGFSPASRGEYRRWLEEHRPG